MRHTGRYQKQFFIGNQVTEKTESEKFQVRCHTIQKPDNNSIQSCCTTVQSIAQINVKSNLCQWIIFKKQIMNNSNFQISVNDKSANSKEKFVREC